MKTLFLSLLALLAPQDEKAIKDKQAEVMAFAKTAKNERDFRAVTSDLEKLALEAYEINKYELSAKLFSDAEKLARTALKDVTLAQSLQEAGKKAVDVGKEYGKAAKASERIIRNEGTPEDYTASGKFLCFVKGAWDIGLADLSKGKDEALKKLAEDDLAAGNPLAIADAWFGFLKKEPAAKERVLFWHAKAWPTLTGVSREKVRERAKTLQRVVVSKHGPAPSGWLFSPPPDVQWAETEFVHSGKYSIAIKSGISTPTGAAGIGQVFVARPGTKLKLSGWVMTDGTSGKDQFLLVYHDAAGKHLGQDGPTVPDDFPFWVRIQQDVTVPPTTARIILNFQANGKQGMIWLDDVSVLDENGVDLIKNGGFE